MERHYSEKEAEAILKLAARKVSGSDGIGESRLIQMAAELGIPREHLEMAAQEYSVKAKEEAEWAAFRKHERADLLSHLGIYLAVNIGLLAIDLARNGKPEWAMWPALGWGIGVAIHIVTYFFSSDSERRKEFKKWKSEEGTQTAVTSDLRSTLDEIAMHEPSKIEAIKLLRERRGLSLAEAKSAVDAYDAENGKVFL